MPGDERKEPAEAASGEGARRARVEDVRRRLERGELDTPVAALETAAAMLDGDRPPLRSTEPPRGRP
jgi:hypothetical protein